MKIAVFYPKGKTAWSVTRGVSTTLSSMHHEVIDCCDVRPAKEVLESQNAIIVTGPEYIWKELRAAYPDWDRISAPKVGWLHETVERDDYPTNCIAIDGKLPVEELKKFTPRIYTPAIQDQKFGMKYLPFGVDTHMFYPREPRDLESMYTGSLYKKRRDFIKEHPEVRTLSAYVECETTEEYADAIGRATVVLDLPSLSEQSNTRVFEVLASRTALITPTLLHDDSMFVHGKHLLYYSGSPRAAFEAIRDKARVVGVAQEIARQGYEEVKSKHTMEHRLEILLKDIGQRSLRWAARKR